MEQHNNQRKPFKGNTWTGALFLLVGGILLMRQMGYPFPSWLFSWQMILIIVGVFIGIRNGFRDFSWLAMILVGFLFISDEIWPGLRIRHYTVPLVIIILGLVFILAPKGMCRNRQNKMRKLKMMKRRQWAAMQQENSDVAFAAEADPQLEKEDNKNNGNTIDIVSIFSGIKKKVLSKQFKGGDIVCIFGGSEVNLSNADFESPVELELVQIFGGAKLVVPANWEIRSEVAAIFGGVDDKRPPAGNIIPEKTIILKGTVIFGGVEINSF